MIHKDTNKLCPNCGHRRSSQDLHVHVGLCPNCGIAYAKWRAPSPNEKSDRSPSDEHLSSTPGLLRQILDSFLYIPQETQTSTLWGRFILWILFCAWGVSFIVQGVNWESIGGSFLHNINLAFHEFGHVLFSPFGRFMMILGGSLFQILMPLIAMLSFSWQMRDNFAAAIMLWWCGQSFIDISPYIADAKDRNIPLIGGLSEEYHDWGNLLTMTGSLNSAQFIANVSFVIGSVLMILALYWAAIILLKQKRGQRHPYL